MPIDRGGASLPSPGGGLGCGGVQALGAAGVREGWAQGLAWGEGRGQRGTKALQARRATRHGEPPLASHTVGQHGGALAMVCCTRTLTVAGGARPAQSGGAPLQLWLWAAVGRGGRQTCPAFLGQQHGRPQGHTGDCWRGREAERAQGAEEAQGGGEKARGRSSRGSCSYGWCAATRNQRGAPGPEGEEEDGRSPEAPLEVEAFQVVRT
eukprot:scaffold582_cov385-Prasinococcus_capsulatus_cf.AAC.24